MSKNRNATVIALFLMFTMAFSIIASASAQSTDYFSGSYYDWPVDDQATDWQAVYLAELNDGPTSAHVRWVYPFDIGGLAGGETTNVHAFDCGDAYAGKWSGAGIVGGIAYWQMGQAVSPTVTVATDIRTGEELWRGSRISGINFDQTILTDEGIDSYLWDTVGSVYVAYDPWTMQWAFNMTNMPSGTRTFGEKGEIILYSVSLSGATMTYWNQLTMLEQPGAMETLALERSIDVMEFDVTEEWSIPEDLPGSIREYRWGDRVIGTYENEGAGETTIWAFSLEPGKEGDLLYNKDATYELGEDVPVGLGSAEDVEYRLLGDTPGESAHIHYYFDELRYWSYSYDTGELLWSSDEFEAVPESWGGEHYMNHYGRSADVIGNVLYTSGYGGIVIAYHATEGVIWTYHANDPYSEILWSNDWPMTTGNAGTSSILSVGDLLYFGHTEHSVVDPKPRGAPFLCLNATNGDVVWRVDGMYRQTAWGGRNLFGSGVMLTGDTYDQRTYCVGDGPTATTVSVPDGSVPFGSDAMIQGTVMDISPGCSDIKVQLRFPFGVPAVSEESMSEWMLYVYKQFPRPVDAVGVDVTVTVFDSDGEVYDSATVTSDADGDFSYEFAADDAGEYNVKASFAGSNSYYGSFAMSKPFVVEEAIEPTPSPTPEPESVAELYFVPAVAGIIVVLVVIGAVLVLLLLRKR